ncbi:putative plant self-incompatibility S1 [Lupinus albus]|uniref:S-protein homolog n=1 Tax=Lupinus albus TaxID=3870 RepID=A0A6A4QF43_LUPAL|nr:putative plant self-incompatibility S1 [Lupinus albus]
MVGVESIFGIETTKVRMTNKISSPLTHCKDKKHDDGFYTLKTGENHRFKFIIDPFGVPSLWFCSFNWTGGFHYFDIYSEKRDLCTYDCTWDYEKGPCKTAS